MKLIAFVLILYTGNSVVGAISHQKRIVGGVPVIKGEAPYHATLYRNGVPRCGCVLVSKLHLVSVAHCVENIVKFRWMVVVLVGSLYLNEGMIHKVSRISYHPGFTRTSSFFYLYDVAVIHLANPVVISNNVAAIGLPLPYAKAEDVPAIITGYGCALNGLPLSARLLKLETKTISLEKCQEAFDDFTLARTNICALKSVGYGCCYADRGNALVDETKSTLIGIMSVSSGACGAGVPDVFTKISYVTSYIEMEMNYSFKKTEYLNWNTSINFIYVDN